MAERTWRQVLHEIISDPTEYERLIKELGIEHRTLERAAKGISKPRVTFLLNLLRALPEYEYILPDLMAKEFPDVVEQYRVAGGMGDIEKENFIPHVLIERILQQRAFPLDALVLRSIGALILENLVLQLDKERHYITALIVRCLHSGTREEGPKVTMLREYLTETSLPMPARPPTYFYGRDSLVGQVITTQTPSVINDMNNPLAPAFPTSDNVQSVAAFPICSDGGVAGSLMVYSSQQSYFSQIRLALVRKYCALITLAFRESDFYPPDEIALELAMQPSAQLMMNALLKQRTYLILLEAEQRNVAISYDQAQMIAIRQVLEQERT